MNTMELELKHLAPYLPYKLKVLRNDKPIVMNMGQGASVNWIGINAVLRWNNSIMIDKPKVLLRPLSRLTEEIEHNGEKFVPIETLVNEMGFSYLDMEIYPYLNYPYIVIQKLFEWHFDVFGLIPAGLAIEK